jgi:hypothetical protein
MLLIVTVGLVVRDALALEWAARAGARAAAVTGDDLRAEEAVRQAAGPLDAARIEIEVSPDDRERRDPVTVRLTYAVRVRIPVVSRIVSRELILGAEATMQAERAVPTPSPTP